jgi:hypothetical protein
VRRPTAGEIRALIVAVFLVAGICAGLVAGISGLVHAHQTDARGVAVTATVTATQADNAGQDGIVVDYITATGQAERGTVNTIGAGRTYAAGYTLTVKYDLSDPAIVALPAASRINACSRSAPAACCSRSWPGQSRPACAVAGAGAVRPAQ